MDKYQSVTLHLPTLQAVALQMLGSMADAEDVVQDTIEKWLTIDTSKIKNAKAYLVTSVRNNCLNHLNNLKRKGEECLHSVHVENFIDKYREAEIFKFDFENELHAAIEQVNKKLEPLERGIFVLREFFDVEYEELQQIFDKKTAHCRKLFSRAKAKLKVAEPLEERAHPEFKENFVSAARHGKLNEFINYLRDSLK